MISKALKLVFFWRRNHLPSIAFKSVFWGLITWFAVGMFTNVRLALIAAGVIAALCLVKYGLNNRQQSKKLMEMCDGDPEKFAALQTKLNSPGMAGTLMREMLNAEMHDEDFDEDDEPLSDEKRQFNISANTKLIQKMATLTLEAKLATAIHCDEVEQTLLEDYASDGDDQLDIEEVVGAFLPDNALCVCMEDYLCDDDHAALVEEFSAATNERWAIEDCTSSYDDEAKGWVVSFKENGKVKTWRFVQHGDCLNEKFLEQVINYTQSKSGYMVTVLDNEEDINLVCLPQGMYEALNESVVQQVA